MGFGDLWCGGLLRSGRHVTSLRTASQEQEGEQDEQQDSDDGK